MAFASHTRLLLGFTRDHARIADALAHAGNMASREPTYLDHSMFEASAQAERSTVPHSRRVLLWLTDGTSNYQGGVTRTTHNPEIPKDPHAKQEATEALLRSGAASAMLRELSGLTYAQMPLQWMSGHSGEFDDFAALTGGPVATTGKDDAAPRMGMLLDELRARTAIGFKPTESKPAGTVTSVGHLRRTSLLATPRCDRSAKTSSCAHVASTSADAQTRPQRMLPVWNP